MKIFLISVFLLPFLASSQVVLPDEVARFYLERHEKVKILEQENKLLNEVILNLEREVSVKQGIIGTYQDDQNSYMMIIQTLREKIAANEAFITELKKEIRRKKISVVFWKILTPILAVASFLIGHG